MLVVPSRISYFCSQIQKVFNETYRSFSPSAVVAAQFPFIVANFTVDGDTIDINVTPDKRTVLLHAEGHIVDALKVGGVRTCFHLYSPSSF
jgi:DNA mismatch repair ATPase MutL